MEEENNNFKNSTSKKYFYFFITLLILITALRATNLTEFLYDDEANFAYTLSVMDNMGVNQNYHSPIPLNLLYIPLISIFGLKIWVFRLLPLIFSVINTLILYKYTQEKYNNKKLATIAASLMLITFYPTLAALQFDVEGNLIMFCAIATFYFYEKSCWKKSFNLKIFSGIFLGIAIIAKQNAAILAIIFLIYAFTKRSLKNSNLKNETKEYLKDILTIGITATITFSLSFLYAYINDPSTWLNTIISPDTGRYYEKHFSITGPSIYFLWATPLLILSPIFLILLKKKQEYLTDSSNKVKNILKKYSLEYIWISCTLLFYTFIITFGAIDKYLMHSIPPLCILTAALSQKIDWNKKKTYIFTSITLLFSIFLFYLNSLNLKSVARIPSLYLKEIFQFNLAFIFSYTSSSGPMLGISFATIFFTTVICILILFIVGILKDIKSIKYLIIIFLSITIAFNIFLTTEYLFHPTSPDISKIKWENIKYVERENLNFPIYSTDSGILWYFENDYWGKYKNVMGLSDYEKSNATKTIKNIKNNKGTLLILHWPPTPKDSTLFEIKKMCKKEKENYYKNILIMQTLTCN